MLAGSCFARESTHLLQYISGKLHKFRLAADQHRTRTTKNQAGSNWMYKVVFWLQKQVWCMGVGKKLRLKFSIIEFRLFVHLEIKQFWCLHINFLFCPWRESKEDVIRFVPIIHSWPSWSNCKILSSVLTCLAFGNFLTPIIFNNLQRLPSTSYHNSLTSAPRVLTSSSSSSPWSNLLKL